ncbi:DUF5988 family protein [Streptomyces sp. NPDC004685]
MTADVARRCRAPGRPERRATRSSPAPGAHEHFRATTRQQETSQGPLPGHEWSERTESPG